MREEVKEIEKVWKKANEALIKERNELLKRVEELEAEIRNGQYPPKRKSLSKKST